MDDHLRRKRNQGAVLLPTSYIIESIRGQLPQNQQGIGRPAAHVFGVGSLERGQQPHGFAQPQPAPAPDPKVFEREAAAELERARQRVAQAATEHYGHVQSDIDRTLAHTIALVEDTPGGRHAARLVVIDTLIQQAHQSLARWQPAATQFYGRDTWTTSAQDFIARTQATGRLMDHGNAAQAARHWRESLGAAEQSQRLQGRLAMLDELRAVTLQQLQAATGQRHGQDPAGWQQQVDTARASADQLLAELPSFLHAQASSQPHITALGEPVQYITALRGHIEHLLAGLPALPPVPGADSIYTQVPVSKADMEVLQQLVDFDRARRVNNQFARAREATLRNESIRHLKELSFKLEALRATTVSNHQQLAQHHATEAAQAAEHSRQAAEHAQREQEERQAREQAQAAAADLERRLQEHARQAAIDAANARLNAWRERPDARVIEVPQLHAGAPVVIAAGAALRLPALPLPAPSLATAIRAAIGVLGTIASGIAASASVLAAGLAVGFIGLLWPSNLAPSDRRGALLMPLEMLPGPTEAELDSAARQGQPVALPFAATVRSKENGLRLNVVASNGGYPLHAQVIDLTLNPDSGAYQALIDAPPRLINVTPVAPPLNPSTELPSTGPQPSVQPGPAVELAELAGNVTPAYEAMDAELYILRYPAESGLPTLYLAVERPPVELGEVGPYNDLARRSVGDGLDIDHIPSRKALEAVVKMANPQFNKAQIRRISNLGAAVAVPKEVHRQLSETYGGRNTKYKVLIDSSNLRTAVDSNLAAIQPGLLEQGISPERFDEIVGHIHALNEKAGHYK